jgi:clan AA aspartic protease
MGLTFADIKLTNSEDLALLHKGYIQEQEVRSIWVNALVDTGASMLTIPKSIQDQLNLPKVDEQRVELGNGSVITVDVVGPVEIRFENRMAIVTAVFIPEEIEVLLGAIPLQSMDVLVDPRQERLIVNPQSTDKARIFFEGIEKMLSLGKLQELKKNDEENS